MEEEASAKRGKDSKMKRFSGCVAMLVVLFFCAPATATQNFNLSLASREDILNKAKLKRHGATLVLRVSGSPYEMGYQRGRILKDKIKAAFLSSKGLRSYSHIPARYINEECRLELEGLADGCGLSYEDVLSMQAYDAGRDEATIIYEPDDGCSFTAVGPVWAVGVSKGINRKGIFIDVTAGTQKAHLAAATLFMLREALQYSESYYDVIRIVSSSYRANSGEVAAGDMRLEKGCVIKFDSDRYEVTFEPEKISETIGYFYKLKGDFNIEISDEEPLDPFEFFDYEKTVPQYTLETREKTNEYEHYSFSYPSAVRTDYPDKRVFFDFYEPRGCESYPVVIFLPHISGGVPQIEGEFCRDLASNGIAALLVQPAYQKDYDAVCQGWLVDKLKENGADELVLMLRQIVIEARRAIDWLETQPKVEKDKIGLMGISLGGIMVPVVSGVDDRIKATAIMLGGGEIGDIIWSSFTTRLYKKRLRQEGIESPRDLERRMWMLDPLTFAFRAKDKPTLMINAHLDTSVPRADTLKLWRALNRPKLIWLPTGHFTSLFEVGYAKIKTFQHFYAELVDREKAKKMALDYTPGSPISTFCIKQEKFVGDNLRVSLSGRIGGGYQEGEGGLIVKDLFGDAYFGGTRALGRKWEDGRYHMYGVGGELLFGRRLTENTNGYLTYSYESVNTYDVESWAPADFKRHIGRKSVAALSFNWERNTLDDSLYPIDGSYTGLSFETASKALGGDYDLLKATAEGRWYITTPYPKITFAFRAKGGWTGEFGDTADVPFYERFYLGGSDDIRGYKSRSIGPKDDNNLPLWGDIILLGNAEVRFPIFKGLNGAAFYDVGDVWKNFGDVKLPKDLQNSVGAGLRYRTKWTILRFDYAYPLNRNEDGRKGKLHWGIGMPF